MIFHCSSTIKVSIELPVTTRHRRDMTEKLLKVTLNQNKQKTYCMSIYILCPIDISHETVCGFLLNFTNTIGSAHSMTFVEIDHEENFNSHSPPSTDSRRADVNYWQKYVLSVLVNCLGSLSLLRNSVIRLPD